MSDSVKVLKKSSQDGLLHVFLLRHDFYSSGGESSSPVSGLVQFDKSRLESSAVYLRLSVKYWKGREECGTYKTISEQKEVTKEKLWPSENSVIEKEGATTSLALKKLQEMIADEARVTEEFSIKIPNSVPTSVLIETDDFNLDYPTGVTCELQLYVVADDEGAKPENLSIIRLYVKHFNIIPDSISNLTRPKSRVTKTFPLPNGCIRLEVELEKDVFECGETMKIDLKIANNSKRTVKFVRCELVQYIYIQKTNMHLINNVGQVESSEKCPLTPSSEMSQIYELFIGGDYKRKRGLALEGTTKDKDVQLCSSTLLDLNKLTVEDPDPGVKVFYTVKISLNCGAIGGELTSEVPFFILQSLPAIPEDPSDIKIEIEQFSKFRRDKSMDNI